MLTVCFLLVVASPGVMCEREKKKTRMSDRRREMTFFLSPLFFFVVTEENLPQPMSVGLIGDVT